MNLDTAIQNSLKKSAMDDAMQGVMAAWGPNFQVLAAPTHATSAQDAVAKPVGVMNNSPLSRPVATPEASSIKNNLPSPLSAPKGMESVKQMSAEGINPLFRRAF
jgi:hypothetical protein